MSGETYKKGGNPGELVIETSQQQVKKIAHLVAEIESHKRALERLAGELEEAKNLEIEGAAEAVERFKSEQA